MGKLVPHDPPRSTLAERLARLEEAVARLETMLREHLERILAVVEDQDARLRALERERNHLAGARLARQEMLATFRWAIALLVPALTGSLMAVVVSRLLQG